MNPNLLAAAKSPEQQRLLDLAVQYAHTFSTVGKGVILGQVANLLPEVRTVEQILAWDRLRSAVFDYEFSAGPLAAVETALAAAA